MNQSEAMLKDVATIGQRIENELKYIEERTLRYDGGYSCRLIMQDGSKYYIQRSPAWRETPMSGPEGTL